VNNRYESTHPIQRGEVRDWEKLSKLWENVTMELGTESVDSTSILLVESMRTTKKDRNRWAEMLFESHHAPSISFLNSASASIFASGRTSGLSIDCGAGITSAVPVYEGLPLKHAALIADYGGQDISHHLQQLLMNRHINLSFHDVRSIKESRAYISMNVSDSPRSNDDQRTTLILPDGVEVEVEEDIFSECTNHIFHDDKANHQGLIAQTQECIALCDESLKRLLYGNIILSGGSSQLTGFGDRFKHELQDKLSQSLVVSKNDGQLFDVQVHPNTMSR
jgi:actin-related protein